MRMILRKELGRGEFRQMDYLGRSFRRAHESCLDYIIVP